MSTIHTRQLQQYTQDNYNTHKTTTTVHTRQLHQHTQDNNNNNNNNNNTHKTTTTIHIRQVQHIQDNYNNTHKTTTRQLQQHTQNNYKNTRKTTTTIHTRLQHTQDNYNTHKTTTTTQKTTTTTHTRQLQQYTRWSNTIYTNDNLKLATKHTRQISILQHVEKVRTPKQGKYTTYCFFRQDLYVFSAKSAFYPLSRSKLFSSVRDSNRNCHCFFSFEKEFLEFHARYCVDLRVRPHPIEFAFRGEQSSINKRPSFFCWLATSIVWLTNRLRKRKE